MHSDAMQPSGSAPRSQNLLIAWAYLLGLLALPITVALCGELCLGNASWIDSSQIDLEQSPEVEYALTR